MTDDGVSTWTVDTTAIGVNVTGKCISGAGDHFIFANTIDSILDVEKVPSSKQTSFTAASFVKWHPYRADLFATVCSQFVGLYQYTSDGRVRTVNSGRLHPRKINDIDWSYTDGNTFMTCADGESIALWDCRSSLQRATWELQAITGAEQAKFAPSINHIISTAHGSDIRIWDDRYRSTPAASIVAHSGRITSLAWHPTKNTFVTSGTDGYIKIWDFDSLPKPIHSFGVLQQPVQRIKYSLDGEEFVTIPRAGAQAKTALTIWHSTSLTNLQALKSTDDPIIDVAWQHYDNKKYLFTLRKSGIMRRYPLVSHQEISGSLDMAVPIAQSDADQEVDKMVANCNLPIVPEIDFDTAKLFDRTRGLLRQPLSPPNDTLPMPNFPGTWCCWIKAKSKHSNNLGSELEALRKLNTEGLITNEINFNRAACGFTYEHRTFGQKRIYIEIRFHAMFIKNATILVKIHQKDCALDAEKAQKLLKLVEEESSRIMRDDDVLLHPSDQKCISIFGRVLQSLPELINALQIPGTHIDILSKRETTDSYHGRSVPRSDGSEENSAETESLGRGYCSVGYEPSPFDDYVPAPCTSGARFNSSGFLTIFGRVNYSNSLQCIKFDCKNKFGEYQKHGSRRRPRKVRSARSHRTISVSEKSSKKLIRSLREYELLANTYFDRPQERTSSEYSLNFDNVTSGAGVVGGNMWTVLRKDSVKQTITLGSSPSRSIGMQNISFNFIAHRNRGNSMTGPTVLADDYIRLFSTLPKPVLIYDVAEMLPVSKKFAGKYKVIGGDALELVQHNMKVARHAGRQDLVRVWTVVEQVVRGTVKELREEFDPTPSTLNARVVKSHTDGTFDGDVVYAVPAADDHEGECEGKDCLIRSIPWAANVAGRRLINYIMELYTRNGDFQMAALLCSVLHSRPLGDEPFHLQVANKRAYSNLLPADLQLSGHFRSASSSSDTYHGGVSGHNTIHGGATFERGYHQRLADVTYPPVTALDLALRGRSYESESTVASTKLHAKGSRSILKKLFGGTGTMATNQLAMKDSDTPSPPPTARRASESDTDSDPEVAHVGEITAVLSPGHSYQVDNSLTLIDPSLQDRFEDVRSRYADLLFRWQMYVKSAEILKYNAPKDDDPGHLSARYCKPSCNKDEWTEIATTHIMCTICQTPCKGQVVTCLSCRHGGHMEHMTEWFRKQTWCPSGCGCICLM
ncbi:hypothetical protein QR680_001547 [Steinernema hermaphroditum]|uniref:WDR59/RTC1-like RING zinc finger domain-containing protein n=1 Tax=Steinernema hermaphroditum TaxID=289476 RepID=A0AA39H1L8_9BILA|nr:hypothetical protein QR680_001547 [Steinernema hermaphroditum]